MKPGVLARGQRAVVATLLVAALATGWALWPRGAGVALAGALAVLWVHALVLALEFLLLPRLNRTDPAPAITAWQLLTAWLGECRAAWLAFGWRQPFREHAVPDRLPPPGPTGRRGVVLVHGFLCNRGLWGPWMQALQARGHACVALSLEPVFTSIDSYVPQLERAVAQVTAATGQPPLLVCHSMGGLVTRAWLRQRRQGGALPLPVARVVTLGTPHRGTWLARLGHGTNARQMRQHSDWLQRLAADEPADLGAAFTCWYSNGDNIVAPASTAALAGADNRFLPGVGHMALTLRREVLDDTLAWLAANKA